MWSFDTSVIRNHQLGALPGESALILECDSCPNCSGPCLHKFLIVLLAAAEPQQNQPHLQSLGNVDQAFKRESCVPRFDVADPYG